ncbi:NADP-dependent oxidoreductase [Aminobacter aganoensis]|uniref:NADPH:quinone reductase-like Zn-dependent oxidoreductase n=1 Tax=Aminobacter aganoensis TaxID=83264 RepID=A0A7X0FDC0_9HYPH|nr:NADP-dependent oxidoreductase [Aminobacter aganoensis]MBB6357353.1 NADPH:quinone reductase-like Zn-dependent oxidoreductase [Aminobacter aganoensis]
MRAITQTTVGGPEVLELADVPAPQPKPGEVLIRTRAAGVNPVDAAVRGGYYPLLGEPAFTVGWDVSGTVEAVGSGVTDLAPGDEVFGMPRFPAEAAAYAELVTAPASELARKPETLDHLDAGALPLAGLTAWQGLVTFGRLKAGDRVLIQAGAGGVGHLAVQIAKARSAYVIATASPGKVDFVRSLGADEVIDYTSNDFIAKAGPVDMVFEALGGDHPEKSLKVLKNGGTLVVLLGATDKAAAEAETRGIRIERISVRPDRAGLEELAKLVEAGKLKVHVARSFPLAEAAAAHSFLADKPIGKVVLTA